jgi:hypothetical protein
MARLKRLQAAHPRLGTGGANRPPSKQGKHGLSSLKGKVEIVVASEMEKGDGDLSGKPQFF